MRCLDPAGLVLPQVRGHQVKTPQQLVDLYYASVGRGASFLLNLPPDRRGKIHENDATSLRDFRRIIDATFSTNLWDEGHCRGNQLTWQRAGSALCTGNVLDGSRLTYWATDDDVLTPSLTLELPREVAFNVVRLREHLPLGQRVISMIVDMWRDGQWAQFGSATSIGNCRLIRGSRTTTSRVRIRITQASVCPAISEVGLFLEPST